MRGLWELEATRARVGRTVKRQCDCCGQLYDPREDDPRRYCSDACERLAREGRRLRDGGPTFQGAQPPTPLQLVGVLEHFRSRLELFVEELQKDAERANLRGLRLLAHDFTQLQARANDVGDDVQEVLMQIHRATKRAKDGGTP